MATISTSTTIRMPLTLSLEDICRFRVTLKLSRSSDTLAFDSLGPSPSSSTPSSPTSGISLNFREFCDDNNDLCISIWASDSFDKQPVADEQQLQVSQPASSYGPATSMETSSEPLSEGWAELVAQSMGFTPNTSHGIDPSCLGLSHWPEYMHGNELASATISEDGSSLLEAAMSVSSSSSLAPSPQLSPIYIHPQVSMLGGSSGLSEDGPLDYQYAPMPASSSSSLASSPQLSPTYPGDTSSSSSSASPVSIESFINYEATSMDAANAYIHPTDTSSNSTMDLLVHQPADQTPPPPPPSDPSYSPPENQLPNLQCPDPSCTRLFKRTYTLKSHLLTHQRPNPSSTSSQQRQTKFPCSIPGCTQLFSRKHDRMRHEVLQHGRKSQFSCAECGRFFASQGTLERHIAKHREGLEGTGSRGELMDFGAVEA